MAVVFFVYIIYGIIFGIVVNKVLENKGYNENWFWWGFLFGIFAVIVALSKPNINTIKTIIKEVKQSESAIDPNQLDAETPADKEALTSSEELTLEKINQERQKKTTIICGVIVVTLVVSVCVFLNIKRKNDEHLLDEIERVLSIGNIQSAQEYVNSISNDEMKKIGQDKVYRYYYDKAEQCFLASNYEAAREYFELADGYEDSDIRIKEMYIEEAMAMQEEYPREWEEIFECLDNASGHPDSENKYQEAVKKKEYEEKWSDLTGKKSHLREMQPYFQENSGYEDCDEVNSYIERALQSKWIGDWVLQDTTDSKIYKYLRIEAAYVESWGITENCGYYFSFANSIDDLGKKDKDSFFYKQRNGYWYEYEAGKVSDNDDDWGYIYVCNENETITYFPFNTDIEYTYRYIDGSCE